MKKYTVLKDVNFLKKIKDKGLISLKNCMHYGVYIYKKRYWYLLNKRVLKKWRREVIDSWGILW
jgi:hypothetical protein